MFLKYTNTQNPIAGDVRWGNPNIVLSCNQAKNIRGEPNGRTRGGFDVVVIQGIIQVNYDSI